MTQLTALDAGFLRVEGGTMLAHIGGLGILDTSGCPGGRLTLDRLVELVRERSHLARPLRQRLVETPFGIDRPYWSDDPDFDPARHVAEVTLFAPGDERQLADEVARLHATPLDRSRPLWELYLIRGLEGGRAAIYAKVHHAAIDGVLAAELLAALLDLGPEPRAVEPPGAGRERAPGRIGMVRSGMVHALLHPVVGTRSLARAMPYLDEVPMLGRYPGVSLVSRTLQSLLGRSPTARSGPPARTAPRTPFNGTISSRRAFAYGSLPLADIKAVRKVMGVSVNDVVMALCASALRRWLVSRAALPDRPLVAAVPVSLRRGGSRNGGGAEGSDGRNGGGREQGEGAGDGRGGGAVRDAGNRVTLMIASLPTDVADPKERFDASGEAMRVAKRRFAASEGIWVEALLDLVPAPVALRLVGPMVRRVPASLFRAVNLVVSNVPGPQFPLYLHGARVLGYYPVSVVSDLSGGLNITVFSYDGDVNVGLVACRDMIDDLWELMDFFHDALAELKEICGLM